MKRSCKNIDITDWRTDEPWVADCILRHKKRPDFRELLLTIGEMSKAQYFAALEANDNAAFAEPIRNIAKEAARRIEAGDLQLDPVRYREMVDKSSGKTRIIGKESPMQQVLDHIAVGAAEPIAKRRIVPQQVSSLPGRGQIVGTQMIQRWVEKDNRAAAWAARHHVKYTRQCRYYVRGVDISKCFPSMRLDIFLAFFCRDCGNSRLIWLWETLLRSHRADGYLGFMIGALPSQWAAQYLLSFVYRFATGLHKFRRGKPVRLVKKALLYMDDIFLSGSSRRDLKMAMGEITRYVKTTLGLTIKPSWVIVKWEATSTDMMGYRVRHDSSVTVRGRIFLRMRRQALRFWRTGKMPISRAWRLCSYKGFFIPGKHRKIRLNLSFRHICKRLRLPELFRRASEIISKHDRRNHDANIFYARAWQNPLYATA